MAIDLAYLHVLTRVLDIVASNRTKSRLKTIALAYPDILVPQDELIIMFGSDFVNDIETSADEMSVRRWHGLPDTFGRILRTDRFFQKLGLDVDFIDLKKIRGPERIVDLNERIPQEFRQKYDLLIDTGTLEHCFNVGAAFRAMCEFITLGGRLITMAPMTVINHGFWNFSPCAYYEGLTKNGFKVEVLQVRTKGPEGYKTINLLEQPLARQIMPPEAVIMCVAKRITEQEFAWPVQSKYEN
jgi:hypothetical protein